MGVKQSSTPSSGHSISLSSKADGSHPPIAVDIKALRRAFRDLENGIPDPKGREMIMRSMYMLMQKKRGKKRLLKLSNKALLELIKSDDLVVREEYDVLRLIGAWADKRIEEKYRGRRSLYQDMSKGVNRMLSTSFVGDKEQLQEQLKETEKEDNKEGTDKSKDSPNLRGTAGLYQQMSKGAQLHLSDKKKIKIKI